MQKIDNDHLLRLLDEDDEMLASAGETQVRLQIRIDQPSAILCHGFACGNVAAGGDQILLIGRGLPRPEGFYRPSGNVDLNRAGFAGGSNS